jgi:hypothetical protein
MDIRDTEIEVINNQVDKTDSVELTMQQYESKMMEFLAQCNLPTQSILVPVIERKKVFKNVTDALELIDSQKRLSATYLSKFIAASSAGLFDAALNYLWDETVAQLRLRVAHYDIQYFFDLAVTSDKRNKLNEVEDLVKLDDSELIKGAKEIDLISDMGYRHLDYIKYMRNWASAAHPNQIDITGLQLISWLETCIKEVISLPESSVTIRIGQLLKNIKQNSISQEEADQIGTFFLDLHREKVNSLASGFFGIYTRLDSPEHARHNINLLLPLLWERVDEEVRNGFGIKYANFVANSEQDQTRLSRSFLQIVNAEAYLPEGIRAAEIKTALDNLKSAHHSTMNNFYKEPPFARQLKRLVGSHGIPKQLNNEFVITIIDAYLTNGNGECWDADPVYTSLIRGFNQQQAIIALFTFMADEISSKLQFAKCQLKYRELVNMVRTMITTPAVQEFIQAVDKYEGPLYNMRTDSAIQKKVDVLRILIKSL